MPKKKHRMSLIYEGPAREDPICTPAEDPFAASPVEVACEMDIEEHPVWDSPIEKEVDVAEFPMVNDVDSVSQERTVTDEAALAEEPSPASPVPVILHDSEIDGASDADIQAVEDTKRVLVLVCTSCTIMLFTEYTGRCPYRFVPVSGPDHEYYSWLLHTTCSSCISKHKGKWTSRENFGNECKTAFEAALLSEDFMTRTYWFEAASKVCRKPLRVLMAEGRRSVAYVKIDEFRQESTNECRMRMLKPLGSEGAKGGNSEILESFVPGGYL